MKEKEETWQILAVVCGQMVMITASGIFEETRGKTRYQKSNLTWCFPLSFRVEKCVSLVLCVSCVDTWLDKDPPSSWLSV